MSQRILRPFPPTGTGRTFSRFGVQSPASAPAGSLEDVHFLRTWFEYDSEVNGAGSRGGINWYTILGMVLVIGVSATFWTCVGLIVARLWQ